MISENAARLRSVPFPALLSPAPRPSSRPVMTARLTRIARGAVLAFLLSGTAFAQTSPEALDSLRAKATAGNAVAQYNLGLVYADASEPAYDLVEAYVWLSRAAANGSRGRELALVTSRLTSAELAAARQRLAEPLPAPAAPATTADTAAPSPFTPVPLDVDQEEIGRAH